MLQKLRERAQGWFAWAILGAVAVTFVLFGTSSFFSSNGSEDWVAKVNGKHITDRDVEIAYQRVLQQPGSENLRQLDPSYIKNELLQSLIEQSVLIQHAQNMGMTASNSQITSMINRIPFLYDEQGRFSQDAYMRFLASSNYSDHSFRLLLKDSILQEQLQDSILLSAFTLSTDVNDFVKYLLQTRDFRFSIVEKDPFEAKVISDISSDDVKQYFEAHQQAFMTPEQISVEYIRLSLNDLMDKVKYTEDDLHAFYRDNLTLFTVPASAHVAHILVGAMKEADQKTHDAAKEKMARIQQELKGGKSFDELAKEYSDDKMSGEKGGVLQWFNTGEMVPEFEKAAFALKPNEISEPVETKFGYHLIKLIDKKPERVKPFFEVKEEVITKYKQYYAEERLVEMADELSQLVFDTPDTLQAAADKLGLTIHKTELFTQETGPRETFLNQPEIMTVAFSAVVKDEKNNSSVLKLDETDYVVLRLADVVAPKQKPLEDVSNEIKTLLKDQKIDELVKNEAKRIESALVETSNLPDEKALAEFRWTLKEKIKRTDRGVDGDIIETAFSMPRPADSSKRVVKVTPMSDGNYAVVWLQNVTDGKENDLSEQEKQNYRQSLTKHLGELEFALYATELFDEAKIVKRQ